METFSPINSMLRAAALANMIRRSAMEDELMRREEIRAGNEDELNAMRFQQAGRPVTGGLVEDVYAPPAPAGLSPGQSAVSTFATPITRAAKGTKTYKKLSGETVEIEPYTPEELFSRDLNIKAAEAEIMNRIAVGRKIAETRGLQSIGESPSQVAGARRAAPAQPVAGRDVPLPPEVEEQRKRLNAPPEPAKIPGRDIPLPPDVEAQRSRMVAARSSAATETDAQAVADAIEQGLQPPDLKGMYRFNAPVRAALARKGYDLTAAQKDWQAVQRHISTLNGTQQERLRQAVTFTYDSLDVIEGLFEEWKQVGGASGIPVLNRATLKVAKNLPGRPGEIAVALEAQINDLVSELGTVYKGGNSSTDESLKLASENLKAYWNSDQFKRQLEMIRKNLTIRKNSILNSRPVGVTPGSPYTQGDAAPAPSSGNNDPLGIR